MENETVQNEILGREEMIALIDQSIIQAIETVKELEEAKEGYKTEIDSLRNLDTSLCASEEDLYDKIMNIKEESCLKFEESLFEEMYQHQPLTLKEILQLVLIYIAVIYLAISIASTLFTGIT